MPHLDEVSYSREATIVAVSEYYRFITRMYLKNCYVLTPPEGGWPEINAETFGGLETTDEVISLLRHLPYIQSDDGTTEGAAQCRFANWYRLSRQLARGELTVDSVRTTTEKLPESIPPHVIGLTNGGFRNPAFLLDTELGVVYWYECDNYIQKAPTREPILDDAYGYTPQEEAEWRAESVAWAIPDFFELPKDQFLQLSYVPVSPRVVLFSRSRGMPQVQAIYRAYGWPDLERYRKRECLRAVQDFLEEHYPVDADRREADE